MILSLVSPTTGTIELFGLPLERFRGAVLRRVGGLVEKPDFYLYLSARKNLEIIGGLLGGVDAGEVQRVLRMVGLEDRAADRVKTFSHGMKQRLGIAQALLGTPELIVLDEPTSGLDPQGIREVRELITGLSRDHGITVFLSSHLLHEVEQTASTMAILHHGKLVVQGPVPELLGRGELQVSIDADPPGRAREIIAALPYVTEIHLEGGRVKATFPQSRIPEVNRLLVSLGIDVHALVPQRSLEEYFLSLTEGATEVRAVSDEGRP
jgi:ABC-type multidrug transport system ATPase subunit